MFIVWFDCLACVGGYCVCLVCVSVACFDFCWGLSVWFLGLVWCVLVDLRLVRLVG